ncbi:hypothetical protein GTA08_BOTSDO05904 [Neofusicoccum parvum]|uniref:Uncharacterized protein n=3 Tax=Neofusicoccum TaxID=407951 RepID=R1GD56_BOTPV|nr:hypothetical protein UCRNP2_9441 [Neofusicoccum parvum UCRNP2]GME37028.1 hypothetical protein GTA08_BOTSDO05904 [Neofusicoccum parvum]GME58337.1 hypothetical protein GTA08_BOTSDO05904 [Neofusicoccum parvum]
MAPSNTNKPSFIPLEIKPIEFSLTAGTDIPAPLESPPATPGRPPTPGGGPLSSHPTSPNEPPPSDPMDHANSSSDANGHAQPRGRTESVATANTKPGSPGSKNPLSPTPTTESVSGSKRPSSVRRFLGFRSASSSDSLRNGRPQSPQSSASANAGPTPRPGARERRKSGSWFNKRASTMFGFGSLPESGEFANGSAIEEEKPQKKGPPPPKLPELKKLGTELNDGSLGADDLFKNIK